MKQRVRTFGLISVCNLIKELGHDPEEALTMAGLEPDEIYRPGATVAPTAILNLMEAAAFVTKRQDFGMTWGARNDFRRLGPISALLANCDSIRQSVEDTSIYVSRQNWGVRCHIVDMGELSRIDFELMVKARVSSAQYVESLIIAQLPLWKQMLGTTWAPVEVWFHHQAMAPIELYTSMFGCNVRFGMRANAIVCRTTDLDRRVTPADPRVKTLVQAMLAEELKCAEQSFLETVKAATRRLLTEGEPTLYRLAQHMDADMQALESQLSQCGHGFRDIITEVRLDIIEERADMPGMTQQALMSLLGFRELSAMNRFIRQNARRIRGGVAGRGRPTSAG